MKKALLLAAGAAVVLALLAFDPTALPLMLDIDVLVVLAGAGLLLLRADLSTRLRPVRVRAREDRRSR